MPVPLPSEPLRRLIAVARGERPADLLLKNARLINTHAGEYHDADIALFGGRVAGLGSYRARRTIDLKGRFVCPGFIDAHLHLESSMVTPPQFARAVVPRGTTAVVTDPHEIANVLGVAGIRYLLDVSENLPLRVFVMAPSCVPATALETSGAAIGPREIARLLEHPRVLGLAEVMNYPGVLSGDEEVLAKLLAVGDRPIDGHAPGLAGKDLNAYVAAGIGTDHESTTLEEAREKLRLGMRILIRQGTAERNLKDLLPLVTPENTDAFCFCTDDRHPHDLQDEGHLDALVRMAIGQGMDPLVAIRLATVNPARHYRLQGLGLVAPGYRADLIVFDDLEDLQVRQVFSSGQLVAEDGAFLPSLPPPAAAPGKELAVRWEKVDFRIPTGGKRRARVIEVIPGQIVTGRTLAEVKVAQGAALADPEQDLLKIAVIERHGATGNMAVGFVRGFGMPRGALASTVAHDSHNLVVVGASDAEMLAAAREVARLGGGMALVAGERVRAALPLPIAGLISPQPREEVRRQFSLLQEEYRALGGTLDDPFMHLSFLALPVIPALKITDRGLVDVEAFDFVPVMV